MDLGQVKDLTIQLESPMKMDVKNMTLQNLNVMIGANGTGKSLILKTIWCLGLAAQGAVQLGAPAISGRRLDPSIGGKGTPKSIDEITQYIFDHSFEDATWDGEIIAHYDHGTFGVTFDKGKVVHILEELANVDSAPTPVFMSTDLRLYSSMDQYLKIARKMDHLEEMLEFYKLYDVVMMNMYVNMVGGGYKIPDIVRKQLDLIGEKMDLQEMRIEKDRFIYLDSKGEKHFLSTLGHGHQAMLNMMIVSALASGGGGNDQTSPEPSTT